MLRNIRIGDNLSGKTLYLSFPDDLHNNISGLRDVLVTNMDKVIWAATSVFESPVKALRIGEGSVMTDVVLYSWTETGGVYKLSTHKVEENFGVVINIDTSHPAYQYIKIELEPVKTTVAEVNKTTQSLSVKGELIETTGTMQLTTNVNFEALEFIEGTSFQIKPDGTVEASEFIEL